MKFRSEPLGVSGRHDDDAAVGWHDLGAVFAGERRHSWMFSHAYVPTACVLHDRIRVFAAFWDEDRLGRVGYVDLERGNPMSVIGYSTDPVLDVGAPGAFDEHGVTPMAIVTDGDTLRLYYAGWQRSSTVRYLLFTGLAISRDSGTSFARVTDVPVLDRVANHRLVRTGFVVKDGPLWKAWLAQSDGIVHVGGKPTPSYSLGYAESADGICWPAASVECLAQGRDGIFGYGRSSIWRDEQGYHGMLSVRRHSGYRIEYAQSRNGVSWSIPCSSGFALLPEHTAQNERQAETMFPSVIRVDGTLYAFYNGDGFGRNGIRCARWMGHEC